VVGLGNEELVCLNPEPSITSIDLGWHQVGERAGELLESLMNRRRPPKEPILISPLSLVPRKSTDAFNVDDDIVALALRFIAEHSHTPIKVTDVVAHVPISWSSLERRFKDCRCSTIGKEITRFRIDRAKRLLAETELLVKQVAEASGFANTQRLCEVFRRVEGMTPEQYRIERE
jgi:LacI family transcriptional regulator